LLQGAKLNSDDYYSHQITTAQHNYTIIFRFVTSGGTKVTIFADGVIIAERTTWFRRLFVAVCSGDQTYEIAYLQREIPRMRALAGLYDQIQLRVPAGLVELDRRLEVSAYSALHREQVIADREKDIAEGKYAENAISTRERVAKAEARLVRLMSGPLKEFARPFVGSWHQRQDLVRRPRPGLKLVDIVEISVP
jgi:hypothetical protein